MARLKVRLFALFLAIWIAVPYTVSAETVSLLKSGFWEASIENNEFYGITAHLQIGDPRFVRARDFSFYVSSRDRKFRILLDTDDLHLARGFSLPVDVSFSGMTNFHVIGQVSSRQVRVVIDDSEVAAWTHNLTSASSMTLKLPTIGPFQWTYDLTGTTATVTAMASAVTAAGLTGLPSPWNGTTQPPVPVPAIGVTTPPPGSFQAPLPQQAQPLTGNAQEDRDLARLRLEVARADAAKAAADADRARSEADRVRAEADKALAEAQIIADRQARAAEQTRAAAARDAEAKRQRDEQSKAENDAKGVEP